MSLLFPNHLEFCRSSLKPKAPVKLRSANWKPANRRNDTSRDRVPQPSFRGHDKGSKPSKESSHHSLLKHYCPIQPRTPPALTPEIGAQANHPYFNASHYRTLPSFRSLVMPSETEFHLFTSLRYDPLLLTSEENSQSWLNFLAPSPFYMLVYHRDRMLEAAQHFDFHEVAEKLQDGKALHESLLKEVRLWMEKGGQEEALKLRILFDHSAKMTVDISVLPPVSLTTLYPPSLDPPKPATPEFKPSSLTGGALTLGPTDCLPAQSSTPPSPPEWVFRLDTAPTPSTPFTLLKTTNRSFYDASRSRALPTNPSAPAYAEVLLYNEVGELTEGTMTSLYVFRGGRWVTPPVGVPAGEFTSSTLKDDEGNGDEGELRKPFAGRWGHSVRSAKVGAGGQRGTSRRWALKKGFCMEEPVSQDTVTVGEGMWVSNGVRGFGFGRVVQ